MKYVSIDFETANSSYLSACSIGVSVFEDRKFLKSNVYLIKPPEQFGNFHWFNVKIHGITKNMVETAPSFDLVWQSIKDEFNDSIIVCHNALFDTAVLRKLLEWYRLPLPSCKYACTVKIAQKVWPELSNHKLDTVSSALNILLNHHEAESDSRASGLILISALHQTGSDDIIELSERIGLRMGILSPNGCVSCSTAEEAHKKTAISGRKRKASYIAAK